MPKFDLTLKRRVEEYRVLTVDAPDAKTARKRAFYLARGGLERDGEDVGRWCDSIPVGRVQLHEPATLHIED